MKRAILLLFLAGLLTMHSYSKDGNRQLAVQQAITGLQASNENFHPIHLFASPEHRTVDEIGSYIHYMIDNNELQMAFNASFQSIRLVLPMPDGTSVSLLLTQHQILTDDFKITTTDQQGKQYLQYVPGLYYYGIIEGYSQRSVVACSIFNNELACVVSDESGNWNLGPLKAANNDQQGKDGEYAYYNDKTFHLPLKFTCNMKEDTTSGSTNESDQNRTIITFDPCVKIFFDCAYDLYVENGNNATAVSNYVSSLFNVVATLYYNENIKISIQSIHVWTIADPFNYTNEMTAWQSFKDYYIQPIHYYTGDIAQLLSNQTGAGMAFVGSACEPPSIGVFSFSGGIQNSFNSFPTFSWDAQVITHEDGHVLGSYHTHDCVWNGNYTKIDSCGDVGGFPGGNCRVGGGNQALPSNGGTIMSYCHLLTYVGINFVNGFGQQPGDKIRAYVAMAPCFTSCICPPVISITTTIFPWNIIQFSASAIIYGNNTIQSGATAVYNAGNNVTLNPGFYALTGCHFIAQIAPCPSSQSSFSSPSSIKSLHFSNTDDLLISPTLINSGIEFSTDSERDEKARITIFNLLGIQVKETMDRSLSKGINRIPVDDSDLAPGIYLIEINCGDTKTIKKIVKG